MRASKCVGFYCGCHGRFANPLYSNPSHSALEQMALVSETRGEFLGVAVYLFAHLVCLLYSNVPFPGRIFCGFWW